MKLETPNERRGFGIIIIIKTTLTEAPNNHGVRFLRGRLKHQIRSALYCRHCRRNFRRGRRSMVVVSESGLNRARSFRKQRHFPSEFRTEEELGFNKIWINGKDYREIFGIVCEEDFVVWEWKWGE